MTVTLNAIQQLNYSSFDIANYIINKFLNDNQEINNIRLQKILYFLQASFLIEDKESLFTEKFEKWTFGATLPTVYNELKKYGSNPIEHTIYNYKYYENRPFDYDIIPFDPNKIDKDTQLLINKRIKKLNALSMQELVDIIIGQDIFKKYESLVLTYNAPDYNNQEIYDYFDNNISDQIWK